MMRRIALTLVLLAACGGHQPAPAPSPVAPLPLPLPRAIEPRNYATLDTGFVRVTIFLATTRRLVTSDRPGERYGPEDADSLQFATIGVNVPSYRARGTGELPRPGSLRDNALTYRPDPQRDFYVTSTIPLDSNRFVQRLSGDLALSHSRDLLVFVHGFNVSFEDAAVRAAQLVADLNFDGSVLLFSWPSAASVTAYVRDQQSARNAAFQLLRLLKNHALAAQPDRVDLLGHSMGSEVIGKAFTLTSPGDSLPRLNQVIFAAPDVDARVFRREILPRLTPHARRVTMYASSDDDALRASRVLNGAGRLGLGGDSLVVIDGMDTIDATRVTADILGHTLFGNTSFLADLAVLLAEERTPAERRLLPVRKNGLTYYRFRGDRR
jgi:esterase/lipase superfamily enzyme